MGLLCFYPIIIFVGALSLLETSSAQICTNPTCLPTQYCGNTSTFQPVCVNCDVGCYNCTGGGPERCISCSPDYYMYNRICRACDPSCDGCTGAGNENCKKCRIAYQNIGGICRPCPVDTFGVNCSKTCHCLNGPNDCDNKTGFCASWQCEWGWKDPPQCQTACEPNYFGINCKIQCNCPVNDTCSPINGLCASGECHPEYGGPACQLHLPKLVEPPRITNNICGHMSVTWNGWVKDSDIGDGPVALYLLWQEKLNSTQGWSLQRNVSHIPSNPAYRINFTSLDQYGEYRYRVDVRGQDGEKLMDEYSKGFASAFYTTECPVPPTTTPSPETTTTPFKPPEGSLFTKFKLSVINNQVQVNWTIDPKYSNVVENIVLSYAITSYGDCKVEPNPQYQDRPVGNSDGFVVLSSLQPWRTYSVRLVIQTQQQNISEDHKKVESEIKTPETGPTDTVKNVTEIASTFSSFTIRWDDPICEMRGGYFVRYDIIVSGFTQNFSTVDKFITINGLQMYTEYTVQISYINSIGAGPLSQAKPFRTGEGVPAAPVMVNIIPDIRSVVVNYLQPNPSNGLILNYDVAYSERQDFTDTLQKPSPTITTTLTDLSPSTTYYIKVRARTGAGYGNYSTPMTTKTLEDYPGPPTSLVQIGRNETCLSLSWQPPTLPNGVITEYKIGPVLDEEIDYVDITDTGTPGEVSVSGASRSHTVCSLMPGRRYQLSISAKTGRGYGNAVSILLYTEQATPVDPPPPVKVNSTATTIGITINPVVLHSGPLSAYVLYVHDVTPTSGRRKRAVGTPPGEARAKLLPTDVNTPIFFTVGDGKVYNGIQNKQLTSGHQYDIYLQIESTLLGITKTSYSKMVETATPIGTPQPAPIVTTTTDYTAVIVVVVIIIILIILAIIAIIIWLWCQRRKSYDTTYAPQYDEKVSHNNYSHVDDYDPHRYWNTIYSHRESRYIVVGRDLIPADGSNYDMNGIVEAKLNPPITFQQEFHDLPHGRVASWNAALKPQNHRKNRFPHLLPYDHSRVILRPDDNSNDDYVNANFINGYHKAQAYIAAQSPFDEETVLDFWRMIHQTNVSVIVMITNIMEDNIVKCTKYWPEKDQGKVTYGNFLLELIDTQEFASYVIRSIKFKSNTTYSTTKVVHLFDFCSWPDHGVLDDPIPLLDMRVKVREYNSDNPASPLLVHCGTGVGRTGAYIAIDSLLEQYDREGRISVSAFIRRMRKDRIQMVRTVKQYIFIYDAIFEAKHAGKTRAGLDLKEKYHLLTMKNPKTKHSYLRDQFDCLCKFTRKLHSANCSAALSSSNLEKNRFPDVIPTDKYRAVLKTPGGIGRTDYVNALLLDSHRQKDHFIVTQTPLHTTVIDFWKLVYDYNVHTIVMMESYKHEDDTCAEYWPEEKKMKQFEPFFIDSVAVYQQDNITIRQFKIHSMLHPKMQAREIRQFQFNAWNDSDFVPKSKSMILDLVDIVKDWQTVSCDGESPIIVHCKDGATHSGLFVAMCNICDAMLDDGDVDVYHTVKRIKKRRTQIVDLVEQYRFCYKVLWDYMNMRLPGGTLTNMMDHTQADKLYNVGSLSLPSYTSHLEYSQFDYNENVI